MNFSNIEDIKIFLKKIVLSIDTSNENYDDWEWFSHANYTIATEFYGDLMLFLEKVIEKNEIPCYEKDIIELYNYLKNMFQY